MQFMWTDPDPLVTGVVTRSIYITELQDAVAVKREEIGQTAIEFIDQSVGQAMSDKAITNLMEFVNQLALDFGYTLGVEHADLLGRPYIELRKNKGVNVTFFPIINDLRQVLNLLIGNIWIEKFDLTIPENRTTIVGNASLLSTTTGDTTSITPSITSDNNINNIIGDRGSYISNLGFGSSLETGGDSNTGGNGQTSTAFGTLDGKLLMLTDPAPNPTPPPINLTTGAKLQLEGSVAGSGTGIGRSCTVVIDGSPVVINTLPAGNFSEVDVNMFGSFYSETSLVMANGDIILLKEQNKPALDTIFKYEGAVSASISSIGQSIIISSRAPGSVVVFISGKALEYIPTEGTDPADHTNTPLAQLKNGISNSPTTLDNTNHAIIIGSNGNNRNLKDDMELYFPGSTTGTGGLQITQFAFLMTLDSRAHLDDYDGKNPSTSPVVHFCEGTNSSSSSSSASFEIDNISFVPIAQIPPTP